MKTEIPIIGTDQQPTPAGTEELTAADLLDSLSALNEHCARVRRDLGCNVALSLAIAGCMQIADAGAQWLGEDLVYVTSG